MWSQLLHPRDPVREAHPGGGAGKHKAQRMGGDEQQAPPNERRVQASRLSVVVGDAAQQHEVRKSENFKWRPARPISTLSLRSWRPIRVAGSYPQLVDYLLQRLAHVCPEKKTLAHQYCRHCDQNVVN